MSLQLELNVCFAAVVLTLLIYDYTLTIAREIDRFWRRPKRSWAFALFVANRYTSILGHVPTWVYSFGSRETLSDYNLCDSTRFVHQLALAIIQIIGSIIMAMRVYAIYGNSRRVLISIMALWLGVLALGCWALVASSVTSSGSAGVMSSAAQLIGNVGCPAGSYFTSEQGMYIAIAWGGQLLYDFVIFLLTTVRSLRIRKEGSRDITDILLRDGSLYFAVMCGINIANVTVVLVATASS